MIKPVTAQSPNLRCQRRPIPFRCLENTGLVGSSTYSTMVCSENVDDDTRHVRDHQQSHVIKVSEHSNSCPDVSSHSCPYQKLNFTQSAGKQPSTSTPNGLNQNVMRLANYPHAIGADSIYQNEENIELDNTENSGIRIRTDPFSDHYVVEKEIGR